MEKRFLQLIFLIGGAILIWNIWQPLWSMDLNESVNKKESPKIIFEVEKGSSAKNIAKNLDKSGLIVSKTSFLRTLENEELSQSLRYGQFLLSPSMTMREVITVLTTVGTGEMAITVVEGWTVMDIDGKLAELGLSTEGKFKECSLECEFEYEFLEDKESLGLEGYLFPDTYFIDSANYSNKGFINQMLGNFDNKLTEEMRSSISESGRSFEDTINVAAMIEKEVRTEKDIPIVGGIIWKRLDNDWTLGIDATLLYQDEDGKISGADLEKEGPYNTRINTGLPPTAISNPGIASIIGAIYPEDSEYWFYLTTLDTGEVIYGRTNEEHNANKERYL
jgi:UPF0755 protein